MARMLLAAFVVGASLLAQVHSEPNPALMCREGQYIWNSGEQMCNTVFGDSFMYEPVEERGYTMWWFDKTNPNDAVTSLLAQDPDHPAAKYNNSMCHLDSLHKDGPPGPNPGSMTECHPWKDRSCCYWENIQSVETLNGLYGDASRWDRCGPISQACERFWVQEDCFYECDPNLGIYRKFPDDHTYDVSKGHNPWQIQQMPIRASYCDAWFQACKHDAFCGAQGGSVFTCGAVPLAGGETPGASATNSEVAAGSSAGCANSGGGGAGAAVTINMYNSGSSGGGN